MKRYHYITFSIFLSVLVVYLSVGMPFVKYNCMKCARINSSEYVMSVVEIHDDGSNCDCSKHDKCSCGKHHSQKEEEENDGCSKVNIIKINLPILTSSIHLDEAVYPVIDLSVFNYLADLSQLCHDDTKNPFIDDSGPRLRPREYINTICTLLI